VPITVADGTLRTAEFVALRRGEVGDSGPQCFGGGVHIHSAISSNADERPRGAQRFSERTKALELVDSEGSIPR